MKIGLDGRSLLDQKTGVGRYTENLLKNLLEIDSDNIYKLYISNSKWNNSLKESDRVQLSTLNSPTIFWKNIHLPWKLIVDNIDVVHIPTYTIPLVNIKKTIVTIHDIIFAKHPEWCSKMNHRKFKYLVPYASKVADAVIVVSDTTKKELIEFTNIPEDKVHVTYLGVDKIFKILRKNEVWKLLENRFNIKNKYILYVGTMEPRRNLIRILQAYKYLKNSSLINHKMVLVGKSSITTTFMYDYIAENNMKNDVVVLGYVSDIELVHLYNGASVFIYPSLYEGFGLPIIEAMACGTAVITSNLSSMAEIAKNTALLVNPYSVYELTESLRCILTDSKLRNDFIQRGLKHAKKFCWKKTAKLTNELYKNLM